MNGRGGNGDDWAVALAVVAVIAGTAGLIGDAPLFTITAWVLLVGAIVAIVADDITPQLTLAACATGVVIVGAAGTVAGYIVGSDLVAFGGLTICVIGFLVAVAEMWGAT